MFIQYVSLFYRNLTLFHNYLHQSSAALYCNECAHHPVIIVTTKYVDNKYTAKVRLLLHSTVYTNCIYKHMHSVKIIILLWQKKYYLNYHFNMTVKGIVLINALSKMHYPTFSFLQKLNLFV